jgi:hypothetical protein
VKGKPGQNQPASSSCTPEQKDAGHDSDYADEHDGEHPPIERTSPEMTGRTGDPCDDEQPTENRDLKGTFHGAEISHRGPLSSKKTVYRRVLANLFSWLNEPKRIDLRGKKAVYTLASPDICPPPQVLFCQFMKKAEEACYDKNQVNCRSHQRIRCHCSRCDVEQLEAGQSA